jgi:hypothetical protein
MSTSLPEAWSAFCAELEAMNRRLGDAVTRSCRASNSELQELAQNFNAWVWRSPEPGRLRAFESLVEKEAQTLLLAPLRGLEKTRPQRTVLAAIEEYESGLEDSLHLIPQSLMISNKDLVSALNPAIGASWRSFILNMGRKEKPLGLRAAVRKQWLREVGRCAPILGEAMLLLARSAIELLSPWQFVRQESLRVLHGEPPELHELMRERERWLGSEVRCNCKAAVSRHGSKAGVPGCPPASRPRF